MRAFRTFLAALALLLAAGAARAESIVLASTTSVENSGLLAHILPMFTKKTGIEVRVVAQGTGQALETAAKNHSATIYVPTGRDGLPMVSTVGPAHEK